MFLGHYAVALGAKQAVHAVSLGTLILAAQLLDLLWPIFLLLGWEQVRIDPGNTEVTPLDFVSYPISHSLLTVLGWAVLLSAGYWLVRRYTRGAVIVALLILSHWLLDAIVHRPDLPVVPGGDARVGLDRPAPNVAAGGADWTVRRRGRLLIPCGVVIGYRENRRHSWREQDHG